MPDSQPPATTQTTIPLTGALQLPDGHEAPAFLCLTAGNVYLTTAHHSEVTVDLGAASAATVRYLSRPLGDRLVVNDQRFGIPFGKAATVQRAIAAARIRSSAPHSDQTTAPDGPFTDPAEELEVLWLAGAVPEGEPIVAWMVTQSWHTFEHSIGGPRISAPLRLLLTADQASLVAVSEFGDTFSQPLPAGPIEISDNRLARDRAQVGQVSWKLPMNGADRIRPLHRLTALGRAARLREAARLLALDPHPAADAQASALLAALADPDPLDQLAQFQLTGDAPDETLEAAISALVARDTDAGRLAEWVRRWELPLPRLRRLLSAAMAVLDADQAAWALPLHRHLREAQLAESSDLFEQAAVDLELSAHLLVAGRKTEARAILEPRRSTLPNEDLLAVLPPPTADLTTGEGGQAMHIQVLELLAAARGTDEAPDPDALTELARHQPLLLARIRALTRVADPGLATRAAAALAVLRPGGLSADDGASPPPIARGLDEPHLELLQHPVSRENGVFSQFQTALAKVTPPDHSTVRDYCERVSPRRNPEVTAAIADACVALGMKAVPAFVSMGDKRVGIRSHEVPEPFLLIGGAHLDADEEAYLQPSELRAAIAAEIAHLRFKHSRITSSDLWAGVWDKGATALETTAIVLPFMKFLPVDLIGKQRTYEMVSRVVPLTWLQRIYDTEDVLNLADAVVDDIGKIGSAAGTAVDEVKGRFSTVGDVAGKLVPGKPGPEQDVSLDGAHVLAAHRVMQITADRAALALSGDLRATIRAMFLLHSRLHGELHVAERSGLHGCLARRDAEDRAILPDMTVRIAALVAFWLSEDYTRLRARLQPPEEE